jgi:hypothetical protein
MFPWLTNPTNLLQMFQQSPPQGGLFSSVNMRDPQAYWAPGQCFACARSIQLGHLHARRAAAVDVAAAVAR